VEALPLVATNVIYSTMLTKVILHSGPVVNSSRSTSTVQRTVVARAAFCQIHKHRFSSTTSQCVAHLHTWPTYTPVATK